MNKGNVKYSILNFSLILKVLLNFILNNIHQNTRILKTLLKKSFEFNLRQKSFNCLIQILLLVLTKNKENKAIIKYS